MISRDPDYDALERYEHSADEALGRAEESEPREPRPPRLPTGTRGACSQCGAPRIRTVEEIGEELYHAGQDIERGTNDPLLRFALLNQRARRLADEIRGVCGRCHHEMNSAALSLAPASMLDMLESALRLLADVAAQGPPRRSAAIKRRPPLRQPPSATRPPSAPLH